MTWHPITTVPHCVLVRAWHRTLGDTLAMFFGPDEAYTHWREV